MLKSTSEVFQLNSTDLYTEIKSFLENFLLLVMVTDRLNASKSYHLHLFDLLNLSFNVISIWLTSNIFNTILQLKINPMFQLRLFVSEPKLRAKERFQCAIKINENLLLTADNIDSSHPSRAPGLRLYNLIHVLQAVNYFPRRTSALVPWETA